MTTQHPDIHLHLGPRPILDQAAARESCLIDTAADEQWFRSHPSATRRVRPCSPREIAATGCPPGSTVEVVLDPDGGMLRMIIAPEDG
jgi:hypothetical protein